MKLFKKIAAMAMMAALCITMAAPMSADAAQTVVMGCRNGYHLMGKLEYVEMRTYIDREHVVEVTSSENGEEEPFNCQHIRIIEIYRITCECGEADGGIYEKQIYKGKSCYACPDEY